MENKFIKFLCQNNVYHKFMCNLGYTEKGVYGWNEYSYTTYHEYWIAEAFDWSLSPEGYEFWQELNNKWMQEL